MRWALTIWLLFSVAARAATNNLADGTQATAQSAVNAAAHGDTLIYPAGTWTYNSELDILDKGLIIKGQGPGQTVLIRGSSLGSGNSVFFVRGRPTNVTWITGFTFHQEFQSTYGAVQVEPRTHTDPQAFVYVSNCKFETAGTGGVTRRSINYLGCYGLIWLCGFAITNAAQAALPEMDINGSNALTNNWHIPLVTGSSNALIWEDSWAYISAGSGSPGEGTDIYAGGNMEVSHCVITNTPLGDHGGDSALRGSMWHDWNNNDLYNPDGLAPWAMQMRGGTGVIWSNRVHWNSGFVLKLYRADPSYDSQGGAPRGQSYDGNFNQTYPGNGYPTGYPLLDQHGRGPFPSTTFPNCSSGCTTNSYETNAPIYAWNNDINGNTSPLFEVVGYDGTPNNATNYVKPGRDYFDNTQHPTYVARTYPDVRRNAFDGTGGGGGGSTNGPGHAPSRAQGYGGIAGRR